MRLPLQGHDVAKFTRGDNSDLRCTQSTAELARGLGLGSGVDLGEQTPGAGFFLKDNVSLGLGTAGPWIPGPGRRAHSSRVLRSCPPTPTLVHGKLERMRFPASQRQGPGRGGRSCCAPKTLTAEGRGSWRGARSRLRGQRKGEALGLQGRRKEPVMAGRVPGIHGA